MQVKNKIIEQLDDDAKEFFYRLLNDDILVCRATADIPNYKNTDKCGDSYLVYAPMVKQQPFCRGRVMPLYAYIPNMKDDAAYIAHLTEEQALHFLDCMKEQYEPKEVYNFLMEGHKSGTLWNIVEDKTLKEFIDEENDRKIEIVELYHKGEWNSYVCSLYGIKEKYTCGVNYDERNLKAAMKHFAKCLKGTDRAAFDKFVQSEAEM